MKKRCVLLCLILIAVVLSSCSQNVNKAYPSQDLVVDQNRSWFDDFVISDGTVRIKCHVCVLNQTSETMDVCLIGDFSEDQKSGFIKENKITKTIIVMKLLLFSEYRRVMCKQD